MSSDSPMASNTSEESQLAENHPALISGRPLRQCDLQDFTHLELSIDVREVDQFHLQCKKVFGDVARENLEIRPGFVDSLNAPETWLMPLSGACGFSCLRRREHCFEMCC